MLTATRTIRRFSSSSSSSSRNCQMVSKVLFSTTTTSSTNNTHRMTMTPREKSASSSVRQQVQYNHEYAKQPSRPFHSTTASAAGSVLKSWGVPGNVLDCHGDYREETWLEEHIGGPLYEHQKSLPRLPVPDLKETLQRFLPTATPFAEQLQTTNDATASVEKLLQAAEAFPAQAAELQQRLQQRQQQDYPNSSWLQHWWNTAGYLQVRDTILINVSYFFHLTNDPTAATNVQRGAAILTALAQARKLICSGQWPAESVGKGDRLKYLCSTAYKYMFHACRIPRLEQDSYHIYDPSAYNHVIVARKGHFFRMTLTDPVTAEPLPLAALEEGLQQILLQAEQMDADSSISLAKLGWFTTSHRDDWAVAREVLLQQVPGMKEALEVLQSGAAVLCLDEETPVSRAEMAHLLLHGKIHDGRSREAAGQNRWFDKSVQFVVTDNVKAGFIGEHSMMDGMPLVAMVNHVVNTPYSQCLATAAAASPSAATADVQPIFSKDLLQRMNASHMALVEKAKKDYHDWVDRHDIHVQSFHGYGSNFIKQAGFSPDAFVQMAMQMATYRLWNGEQGGTYEATQVRPFLHGRTETTRGVSEESALLVRRCGLRPSHDYLTDNATRREKLLLLSSAVNAHVKYIGAAAQAQGVDRHFLGLNMIRNGTEALPDLYLHPAFAASKKWRVSTSHLTHPKFENWGYGEVVPDGVGLSYSIHPRHCVFNVTALKEHAWTDKLCDLLEEALLELRDWIETEQKVKGGSAGGAPPKSKL